MADFPEESHSIKEYAEEFQEFLKMEKSKALVSKARGIFKDLLNVHTGWNGEQRSNLKKSFHYADNLNFSGQLKIAKDNSDGNREDTDIPTSLNSHMSVESLSSSRSPGSSLSPSKRNTFEDKTTQDKSLFYRRTK